MRALHPISEGRGAGIPPKTGFQPHCRQLRLLAGKASAQPCQKPRKHPFPSKEARQYDLKSYFTVAKERHVSRESQRGTATGSWCVGVRGGILALPACSPASTCSSHLTHSVPQEACLSPKALPYLLLPQGPVTSHTGRSIPNPLH